MGYPARTCATFGGFRLIAAERRLEKDGCPLPLASRSLDILIALVERAGQVVTKSELFKHVWPDTTVGEGNLRVHIAHLRKALREGKDGARYVTTVPGRGYCFVAPVVDSTPKSPVTQGAVADPPQKDRHRLVQMEGDAETVSDPTALRITEGFVTIVGGLPPCGDPV